METVNNTLALHTKELVISLLNWTALEYGHFQHEMGEEYLLKNLLGQARYGYDELNSSRVYWRWWINQWNFRDEGFVQYASNLPPHQRVIQYRKLHSPRGVRVRPHKITLEDIYTDLQFNNKNKCNA